MIELLQEASSILYKFSNQSLCNNFDPEKFPGIQKARATIMGKFISMKVIQRLPFYFEPSKRKLILQISEATVFNKEDMGFIQEDTGFAKSPTLLIYTT
jgi:hypothetical protein